MAIGTDFLLIPLSFSAYRHSRMATNTFTIPLSGDERQRLLDHLTEDDYEHRTVPHSRVAVKKDRLNVVLYNSGKLVVQGKQATDWVQFILEPEILQRVLPAAPDGAPLSEAPSPEGFSEHIGIDESGKGDYFGPLVVAAAYITPTLTAPLTALGIRDSKRIKSDAKIQRIATGLRALSGFHYEELVLTPATYNQMIARMGSVNRVLAWGHATVLENLLDRVPSCKKAVADQFGPEHQIRNALKEKGKCIELIQRHKAESDPAVAAASILARDCFVRALEALSKKAGYPLPKGATTVRPAAEQIVREQGESMLDKLCKTHFRTTQQVLATVRGN